MELRDARRTISKAISASKAPFFLKWGLKSATRLTVSKDDLCKVARFVQWVLEKVTPLTKSKKDDKAAQYLDKVLDVVCGEN